MSIKEKSSLPSVLYSEEYFLTACEGFDVFIDSEGKHISRRLRDAFSVAEIHPGMRILDVGCGRGEIVRLCMQLGVEAYGVDYSEVATTMTRDAINRQREAFHALEKDQDLLQVDARAGVSLSDAKRLPFPSAHFDRVLMFDVVEHLYPWELQLAIQEVKRILRKEGKLIIHTAPNRWYDAYAYPWVRRVRTLLGQGHLYPKDPRAITPVNQDVHVNEQDMFGLRRLLKAAGFKAKIWLDSPPQNREEGIFMSILRQIAFGIPPLRWFFERELFAVAEKRH